MPSPFPGMDPYLEDAAVFPDLHNGLIAYLQEALQPRLPEPYYAATGARVWVEVSQRYLDPDVEILRSGPRPGGDGPQGGLAAPGAGVSPVVVYVPQDEHRETFLDIFTRQDGDERLVTSIEVLSPSNKAPGPHGRGQYLQKQGELLASQVNLVEIDLLRGGQHTTAVPREHAVACAGPFDYHVSIRAFQNPQRFLVYPIRLEARLPEVAIPLLPGDPPVVVSLQAVFDRAYDAGPYRRRVRYAERTPVPPLRPDQAEWANRLLREKGLLPPP